MPAIFFAAVYGGYFGGALGVILIAVLSLCTHDRLVRLNAKRLSSLQRYGALTGAKRILTSRTEAPPSG